MRFPVTDCPPPELVLLILEACESTDDALALTATCCYLHSVGRCYAVSRLSSSAFFREIPCFENALTAARMTQVVVDAERRGELPPLGLSPVDLTGHRSGQHRDTTASATSMSELMAAFALSRLAESLERAILISVTRYPEDRAGGFPRSFYEDPPEEPERMPEFSIRMRRAIYSAFIVGAALAGVYSEPMFKAKAAAPDLELDKARETGELSERQLEFLQRFAVCRVDLDAEGDGDEIAFGRIGRWLFENTLSNDEAKGAMAKRFREGSGRAQYCQSRNGDCPAALVEGGTHSDAHLVIWELMQVFWVRDHIDNRVLSRRRDPEVYRSMRSAPKEGGFYGEDGPGRDITASAVLLGIFDADQIRTPQALLPEDTVLLITEEKTVAGSSVAVFFDWIEDRWMQSNPSGQIYDHGPADQLKVKFFRYFLRRYVGLRFLSHDFDWYLWPYYYEFFECVMILSHDDERGRRGYKQGMDHQDADFHDGTELLARDS